MKTNTTSRQSIFGPSKKCPECYEYMPLAAKICPACKTKVGDMDETGRARHATDWKAYGVAFFAIIIFALYIWWAFFHEAN